jgi:isoleucyl-tRNA synthetase
LAPLVLPELEKARQAKAIGKALDAKVLLKGGSPEISVVVAKADGQKCERCWHWETDVGSAPGHPTICARCVAAIKQSGN